MFSVEFEDWKPFYDRIINDFRQEGFDQTEDREAERKLMSLLNCRSSEDRLRDLFGGKKVMVVGNGPNLEKDLNQDFEGVIAAADAASHRLANLGVEPDFVSTDLDGKPAFEAELSEDIPVAVHAHGDNRDLLTQFVPSFNHSNIVPTTQAEPSFGAENFGGFTDGDRTAFIADHFGASEITLAGFKFDDGTVSKIKSKKLDWAKKLLETLETRRKEEIVS
jgi:Uncharacterized Rossmann fold enzyme